MLKFNHGPSNVHPGSDITASWGLRGGLHLLQSTPRINENKTKLKGNHTSWPDYLGSSQHLFPSYYPKDFRKVSRVSDFFKYTIKEKGYVPAQARTRVRNPQEGSSWEDKIWAVLSSYPPQQEIYSLDNPGLFFHLGRCMCFTTDCEISPHQWGYFNTSSANWSSKLSRFFIEVQAAAKTGSLILGLLNLIYKRYNRCYKKIFLIMLSDLGLKVGI